MDASSKGNSTTITPPWEYDERRLEKETDYSGGSTGSLTALNNTVDLVASIGKSAIKEGTSLLSDISELFKEDVIGQEQKPKSPMSASGSLEFPKNVAKSPKLLEKENEARHKRMVYSSIEGAAREARRFAHEKILDEIVRLEVAGMSPEEKNKILHLNVDYDEKHISTPYHLHALREKKKEQLRAVEEQTQQVSETEVNPKPFMGEGELLKGGENPQHFTKVAG